MGSQAGLCRVTGWTVLGHFKSVIMLYPYRSMHNSSAGVLGFIQNSSIHRGAAGNMLWKQYSTLLLFVPAEPLCL